MIIINTNSELIKKSHSSLKNFVQFLREPDSICLAILPGILVVPPMVRNLVVISMGLDITGFTKILQISYAP